MRIGSLRAKFRALFNAEAMLFINDCKLQILELNWSFDNCVSANDNFDRAICESIADRFLLQTQPCRRLSKRISFGCMIPFSPGEEIDETAIMLFGEDAGRSHDGGLSIIRCNHRGG